MLRAFTFTVQVELPGVPTVTTTLSQRYEFCAIVIMAGAPAVIVAVALGTSTQFVGVKSAAKLEASVGSLDA